MKVSLPLGRRLIKPLRAGFLLVGGFSPEGRAYTQPPAHRGPKGLRPGGRETDDLTIAEVMVLSCPVRKKRDVMHSSRNRKLWQINWELLRVYKDFLTGCDQRVVEGFEFCVSDRFEINGSQITQFIL